MSVWRCASCGVGIPWPVVPPVHCGCGHTDTNPQPSPAKANRSLFREHQDQCRNCPHFGTRDDCDGCLLMDKPCRVERYWLGRVGCPLG